jgi:GT2 family glycosyltransferase/glycosyltransferase involved in cell wall biosynthesis
MALISRLSRRRIVFDLQPLGDLAHRGGGVWQATGEDPRFLLVAPGKRYPTGRVLLQTRLAIPGAGTIAKLYCDRGKGFTAEGFILVPVDQASGAVSMIVELPRRVRALRWDPLETTGEFTQGAFAITEITWLGVLLGQGDTLRPDAPETALSAAAPPAAPVAPEVPPPAIQVLNPNAGRLASEWAPASSYHYRFSLDQFDQHGIAGWVVDKRSPQASVEVDFYLNGELVERKLASLERGDVAASGKGGPRCGFWFAVPPRLRRGGVMKARLCPAGSGDSFDAHAYVFTPRDVLVRGMLSAAESLHRLGKVGAGQLAASLPAGADALLAVRRHFLPVVLENLRRDWKQLSEVIAVPERAPAESSTVDVIVPAYRGVAETLACVESVLSARLGCAFELTVVNDCSPQPELTQALRALSARHGFVLVENDVNLGFVRSVNKAMRLHEDRDVVLLNSDTVVADGWLDRMRVAALADSNIATVTPFSNRATICSFPRAAHDSELPDGVPFAELAAKCAQVNDGEIVDLPTAVGFCMYIRRAALNETGYFDEVRWGHGYGEENDFCLRASSLGWRHVIACDTFVAHHGSTSFGGDKSAWVARNSEALSRLYPDYDATIQRFLSRDPLAGARRRLFVEIVRSRAARYMLFLTHTWGGGASVAATDLAQRLTQEGEAVLVLASLDDQTLELAVFGTNLSMRYKGPQRYANLLEDLLQLRLWQVHIHQLLGFGPEVYQLLPRLGVPHDVTVHDYFYVCPRVNLIDGSQRYCGEPSESACDRCLASNGPHEVDRSLYPALAVGIRDWRARQGAFLREARLVIAPSGDVASRMRRYFPLLNLIVRPHPEPVRPIPARRAAGSSPISVAVIGAIGPHKGFDILKACAEDALRRSLPLRFVVVGYTCDDRQLEPLSNVVITGKYVREDLAGLLAQNDCGLAAFFSVCPETYSYTLSEALAHGLYPVVFDLGAQAERLRTLGYGSILPFPTEPDIINDALVACAADGQSCDSRTVGTRYERILDDYYELPGSAPTATRLKTGVV